MRKNLRSIITIILLVLLIIMNKAIYNIAFATEESSNNKSRLEVENSNTEEKVGAYNWKTVATYFHENAYNDDGDLIYNESNDDLLIDVENHWFYESINNRNVNVGFTGTGVNSMIKLINDTKYNKQRNFLFYNASVYCLKQHNSLDASMVGNIYNFGKRVGGDNGINLKNITTCYNPDGFGNTNVFTYAAAFSEKHIESKKYMTPNPSETPEFAYFNEEEAQKAIWAETNQTSFYNRDPAPKTDLWKAAKALDGFENEISVHGTNLEVSRIENETGTFLINDDTQYKIGPFTMSDYAYANSTYVESYSGRNLSVSKQLIGGIINGYVEFDDGTKLNIGDSSSSCYIKYKETLAEDRTRKGNYWEAPSDYIYPWPNSTFYIIVNRQDCENSKKMTKINLTYRKTEADGKGWVIEDFDTDGANLQPLLVVKNADVYVKEAEVNALDKSVPLTTNVTIDKYITKVEHTDGSITYGENNKRENVKTVTKRANPIKVSKGDKVTFKIVLTNTSDVNAKFQINDYLPTDSGYTLSSNLSSNDGFTFSESINNWLTIPANGKKEVSVVITVKGSNGLYYNYAEIKTRNNGKNGFPLNDNNGPIVNLAEFDSNSKLYDKDYYKLKKVNVSIDKRIVEVKHDSNNEVTYSETATNNRNVAETIKENNPVYVEFGDIVKYEILLTNAKTSDGDSEETYVNIEDTLPINYSDLSVNVSNNTGTVGSVSNGKLQISNIKVPANGTTKVTVSLIVNENSSGTKRVNTVKIIDSSDIDNESNKTQSSDYYSINDYNMSINKYISKYNKEMTESNNSNGFTNESISFVGRATYSEDEKKNNPLAVEQSETIVYSISLRNDSTEMTNSTLASGSKPATSVRPTSVTDTFNSGLSCTSVSAKALTKDGKDKYGDLYVAVNSLGNGMFKFSISDKTSSGETIIIEPGEYLIYYVTARVDESNMYLYELQNSCTITDLTNINHTDSKSRNVTSLNTSTKTESSDYVRLKDLVISGKVWLDSDKDGYIGKNKSGTLNSYIDYESNPSSNITAPSGNNEYAMKGVTVKLYRIDGDTSTLVRTTKTDENGLFTFAKKEDGTWHNGAYTNTKNSVTDSEQRIPRATNKGTDMKYSTSSNYIQYYIEYEYDGVVYKSTSVYSGDSHLNSDGSFSNDYKIDSNATEFKSIRDTFDESYEIIGYNKAYDAQIQNKKDIAFAKYGHNSYFKVDKSRIMTSRTFLYTEDGTQKTKYLWLYGLSQQYKEPQTEHLKYINLGLEEREDVDLSIVQDVYEVHNIINGEDMTYWYNQNSYAKDGTNVDHDTTASEAFSQQFYMTGYKDDNSALTPYKFKYYLADYDYKFEDYSSDVVKQYKTQDSELNSEVTFRIKVINNSIPNDEPYLSNAEKDIKVYTGINEIIEYFDKDFMNIQYNDDGTVKSINVKTKDENGYLVDTDYKIAEAWFVLPDGSRIPAILDDGTSNNVLTLSKDSIYNSNRTIDGYNTVYIRPETEYSGRTPIILAEGENVDILIKFTVDKDEQRNLKLGLKTAVAEIGAYSTYYKRADGTYYSAGLIDKDSNAGNFGETYDSPFYSDKNNNQKDPYLKLYEDDTFKSGIKLSIPDPSGNPGDDPSGDPGDDPGDNVRSIKGQVWDDARSSVVANEAGEQYIGDGYNGKVLSSKNNSAYEKAKINKIFANSDYYKKEEQEKQDFSVPNIGAKLVEVIKIPINSDGTIRNSSQNSNVQEFSEERIYEETIKVSEDSIVDMRTGDKNSTIGEGKYILKGYIPGEYIVRFSYGDKYDTNGDGIIDDKDIITEQMQIFNGQDYKSTTYQAGITTYADNEKDTDKVLEALEKKGLSDAKDDEIKRLETISYSETLNNNKTLVLRGINSINKEILNEKTNMTAETATFLVKSEKENKDKKTLTYQETIGKFIAITRHPIINIDFGLQYRPEQQVGLNKYVKNIIVTTSANNSETSEPLVNAKFKEYYGIVVNTDSITGVTTFLGTGNAEDEIVKIPENMIDYSASDIKNYVENTYGSSVSNLLNDNMKNGEGKYKIIIAGTELDTENSTGISNLQFVANSEDSHSIDSIQGFAYLNIDDEIMQGAEIKIEYLFTANNLSEIDRVNKNLSELRFKDNNREYDYSRFYPTTGVYSGAMTARNYLFNQYFAKDTDNVVYRKKPYTIGENKDENYYGAYLGSTYYTGKLGENDIVAELKVDSILDYIDNNLVFRQDQNNSNTIDSYWSNTLSSELVLNGFVDLGSISFEEDDIQALKEFISENIEQLKDIIEIEDVNDLENIMSSMSVNELKEVISEYLSKFLNSDLTIATNNEFTNLVGKGSLLDSKGVSYNTKENSNLAIMQNMRTSDNEEPIANADITKYLLPRDSSNKNSFGKVRINISKVISAQEDTSNMTYENIGEIIQYSSVTGRVTNLNTTVGNVNISELIGGRPEYNSQEYETGKRESDTASVERVTLTPPTGMSKTQKIIRKTVKGFEYIGIISIIAVLVVLGSLGGIRLYRKRRIK